VTSEPLLDELRDVLEYPKIRTRLDARGVDVARFLDLLRFFVTIVPTDAATAPSVRDPDDRELLAARTAGNADWLITGDQDLLVLNAGQPVLSPSDFVARFLD
jgi:putative PIN family toxin of toxin-antitoxin system